VAANLHGACGVFEATIGDLVGKHQVLRWHGHLVAAVAVFALNPHPLCLVWGQSGMSRRRHRPLDFGDHTATKNYSGVYLAPTWLSSKHYRNCDRLIISLYAHPTKHTLGISLHDSRRDGREVGTHRERGRRRWVFAKSLITHEGWCACDRSWIVGLILKLIRRFLQKWQRWNHWIMKIGAL
jgi:hypothetical protein